MQTGKDIRAVTKKKTRCQNQRITLDELVQEFSLLDTNHSSALYNQTVSPAKFLGVVSGWYSGYAT